MVIGEVMELRDPGRVDGCAPDCWAGLLLVIGPSQGLVELARAFQKKKRAET